ncbi:bacteriocin fulvocin C-related protein [Streptosporangium sp. NPDC002524]|uniref:bacteriocin fulvocin C-related protein n=1 Tax=Streptosporangium sp. NPDC002524 TaxID=3154537 RepID=UPI00332B0E9C
MQVDSSPQWILAFDASCGQCRGLADKVKKFAGQRLEIVPLMHPEVVAWRKQALGDDAPYTPTLIRVGHDDVRAWTGAAMAIRLAARLGVRGTYGLLTALGENRKEERHATSSADAGGGRRNFLRLAGLGVAVSVIAGRTSLAQAAVADPSPAERWVQANKANLPQTYEAFGAHDLEHRRAIFNALPPQTRSRLWVDHLREHRGSQPNTSAEQNAVFDAVMELAGDSKTFAAPIAEETHHRLVSLQEKAVAAFGEKDAAALFANLGPRPASTSSDQPPHAHAAAAGVCECSTSSPLCGGMSCYRGAFGCYQETGCGFLWDFLCNGLCCTQTTQGLICY